MNKPSVEIEDSAALAEFIEMVNPVVDQIPTSELNLETCQELRVRATALNAELVADPTRRLSPESREKLASMLTELKEQVEELLDQKVTISLLEIDDAWFKPLVAELKQALAQIHEAETRLQNDYR